MEVERHRLLGTQIQNIRNAPIPLGFSSFFSYLTWYSFHIYNITRARANRNDTMTVYLILTLSDQINNKQIRKEMWLAPRVEL